MQPKALSDRLGEDSVRKKLPRAICNFPSEWEQRTVEARHEWLRDPANSYGLNHDANWQCFAAHVKSTTFADLPAEYLAATWRFHPTEFITVMRRCGWLSNEELERIYPATPKETQNLYRSALNRTMRKYLIESGVRRSHFLGQGAVESNFLRSMQESSMSGLVDSVKVLGRNINRASTKKEIDHWYGAQPGEYDPWFSLQKYNSRGVRITGSYSWINGNVGDGDAQKFRGRGFKQLTGRDNYCQYWLYRGWLHPNSFDESWWTDPQYLQKNPARMKLRPAKIENPHQVTLTPENCIDSGGWYMSFRRPKVIKAIDRDALNPVQSPEELRNEKQISRAVTFAINGGYIEEERRLTYTRNAKEIFL